MAKATVTKPTAGKDSAAGKVAVDEDLLPKEEDLIYEEELLRTPHVMKLWWRYLEARKDATSKRRYLIYERAVKALPGSYKVRAYAGTDVLICAENLVARVFVRSPVFLCRAAGGAFRISPLQGAF